MKYYVTFREVHYNTYEVEAESKEEAQQNYDDCSTSYCEYSHTNGCAVQTQHERDRGHVEFE